MSHVIEVTTLKRRFLTVHLTVSKMRSPKNAAIPKSLGGQSTIEWVTYSTCITGQQL
ncbi:MAG: hypothetical protein HC869_23765 [Rhodospirillales bacterium]|nr:hypothetical protein [Rhodospirillales bacterium]